MLGAVDAPGPASPGATPPLRLRPRGGVRISRRRCGRAAFSVLSVRWHGSVIHSVSGSPANHYTRVPERRGRRAPDTDARSRRVRGLLPRRSSYVGRPGRSRPIPTSAPTSCGRRDPVSAARRHRENARAEARDPGRGAIPLAALLLALAAAPVSAQCPRKEAPQVAAQEPVQETAQDPAQEPVPGPLHIPNRGGHFFMDAAAGYGYMRS